MRKQIRRNSVRMKIGSLRGPAVRMRNSPKSYALLLQPDSYAVWNRDLEHRCRVQKPSDGVQRLLRLIATMAVNRRHKRERLNPESPGKWWSTQLRRAEEWSRSL